MKWSMIKWNVCTTETSTDSIIILQLKIIQLLLCSVATLQCCHLSGLRALSSSEWHWTGLIMGEMLYFNWFRENKLFLIQSLKCFNSKKIKQSFLTEQLIKDWEKSKNYQYFNPQRKLHENNLPGFLVLKIAILILKIIPLRVKQAGRYQI